MKLTRIKSSVYKKVLGVFGAAGFLVTFQACYGTPQNYISVDGKITDKDTSVGVGGLQVSIVSDSDSLTVVTDSAGNFYTGMISQNNKLNISVIDTDGEANGSYIDMDTSVDYEDQLIELEVKRES